jgi:hypothetical protein
VERTGIEPVTSGLQSRDIGGDVRSRTTTNARSHAALHPPRRFRGAWLCQVVPRRLGVDWASPVPFYEIEIRERDDRVTRGSYMEVGDPNAEEWLHEGDRFEYEGVTLRVLDVEHAYPPFDRRLVCVPLLTDDE